MYEPKSAPRVAVATVSLVGVIALVGGPGCSARLDGSTGSGDSGDLDGSSGCPASVGGQAAYVVPGQTACDWSSGLQCEVRWAGCPQTIVTETCTCSAGVVDCIPLPCAALDGGQPCQGTVAEGAPCASGTALTCPGTASAASCTCDLSTGNWNCAPSTGDAGND